MSTFQEKFNQGGIIEFEKPTVVLASASPRRTMLLSNAGIRHIIIVSTVDDTELNPQFPHDGVSKDEQIEYAKKMALAKISPFIGKVINGAVITADTTVFCEGRILEKPLTQERCRAQHEFISGKTCVNYTAHAIYYNGQVLCEVMPTDVKVGKLPGSVIDAICEEPEILDCAGFRSQGLISSFLEYDENHVTNLAGLHVPLVLDMLNRIGFPPANIYGV